MKLSRVRMEAARARLQVNVKVPAAANNVGKTI
jgi:hypothetical protein